MRNKALWISGQTMFLRLSVNFFVFVMLAVAALPAASQDKCLQPGRLEVVRKQIADSAAVAEDPALKAELLKFAQELTAATTNARVDNAESEKAKRELAQLEASVVRRVCTILNESIWPKTAAVGVEGANAFLYLIAKALPLKQQLELYPLVSDAYVNGELSAGEVLASYIDRLRLAIGRKQLYGSQVTIRDGFLVMAPIELAADVDKRRAEFKLQPLRAYERSLEVTYKLPLIRGVMEPVRAAVPQTATTPASSENTAIALDGDGPAISVETAYVSIDVNIPARAAALEKTDFKIFDNGKLVEIETFSKSDTPFDIVLLLDLSGSTSDKIGLIRKTTRRFVEMKRPADRLAVIAFNDTQTVVSELESDRAVLLDRIKKIGGSGGSYVWDSIKFSLDLLEKNSDKNRRKAIVLMSDGVDNLLTFYGTMSPRMGFADLAEQIQNSNITIFPVYLDTSDDNSRRVHEAARRTLAHIADQSGGTVYTARKLDDLTGIYDRVLNDVGSIYTLGFTPDVDSADRHWRTVKVEIPSQPNLKIRHRPGYFTK